MKNIWKVLGVVLITYSLIVGLLIPLTTGIKNVAPRIANTGEPLALTLSNAYNATFTSDKDNYQARILLNEKRQALCATRIEVKDNQNMTLFFDVPAGQLPIQTLMENGKKSPFPLLELLGENNGYSSLESVIYFQRDTLAPLADAAAFCNAIKYTQKEEGMTFPFLNILEETIRNLYYHVPMWFAMMLLMAVSVVYSILYLNNPQREFFDRQATAFAAVGILYGVIGLATGAMWAKHTWGAYWSFDVKQNTTAVALLIYLAYFVLRSSFDDLDKRARVAAIYNIFAFATLIPLLYIVPRMFDSLHPGMGGNPAFSKLDLDNTMRMVFYPAIIGWIIIGIWMADVASRIEGLRRHYLEQEA
ncbi:MAG: cytochrome c biogenesis protein [Aureispira sp.]